MNRTSRQLLAVMVVTTALCADHVALAAPAPRMTPAAGQRDAMPQVVRIAGRLVDSLSKRFSQTVVQPARTPEQQFRIDGASAARSDDSDSQSTSHPSLSPFQFRLPPPAI